MYFCQKKREKKISASGGRICGFDAELCIKDLSLKLNHFYMRCVSITVVKLLHFLGAKEGSLLSQLQHVTQKKGHNLRSYCIFCYFQLIKTFVLVNYKLDG